MTGWSGRRLHFVGIAGAGMSAYALAARALGAEVTGSDRADSPYLVRVREAGIAPAVGHRAENVPQGDGVEIAVSTAIPADNPELVVARERGLRVLSRAELLGELTALRRTIAVAGAHGKTTTSSMVAHALLACGLDPGYLIGGTLSTTGVNGAWGSGEWLVVEADESDRSFLSLDVEVAVVTNVELDHHTEWESRLELEAAFRQFVAGARHAVLPPHEWHGPALAVPGAHNQANAAAALEACVLAGADREDAAAALATFRGAGRRFEALGAHASGARVVDDYAHHPTEVAATIAAARQVTEGRVIVVFQPHLFSRTQLLAREFGRALAGADVIGLVDVYPARERAEDFPGVSGLTIAETTADAAAGRRVLWLPGFDDAKAVLDGLLRDGDLLLVVGAGNVDDLGRSLVAEEPSA